TGNGALEAHREKPAAVQIEELYFALPAEVDVRWLEVAMDDVHLMQRGAGIGDGDADGEGFVDEEPAAAVFGINVEGLTDEQLHAHPHDATGQDAAAIDHREIGVADVRERNGFAAGAPCDVLVTFVLRLDELDGDASLREVVGGLDDAGEATLAQHAMDG